MTWADHRLVRDYLAAVDEAGGTERARQWALRVMEESLPENPSGEHIEAVVAAMGSPESIVAEAERSPERDDPDIRWWALLAVASTVILLPLPILAIPLAGLAIAFASKPRPTTAGRIIAAVYSTGTIVIAAALVIIPAFSPERLLTSIGAMIGISLAIIALLAAICALLIRRSEL